MVLIIWTEFERECLRLYGKRLDGKHQHYCPDWDGLPIDDTCQEFETCTCPKETDDEQ